MPSARSDAERLDLSIVFGRFFFLLRERGVPVSPTSFLRLQDALGQGMVTSLTDFYIVARALFVKRTRHMDLYDQVFAHYFEGKELESLDAQEIDEDLRNTLLDWLKDPDFLATLPDDERERFASMDPDELVQYFLDRMAEQTSRHQGGSKWIGTGGTSPVGHGGYQPGGMRVGGRSGMGSALKVALDRRYIDYSDETFLGARQIGEALRAVRDLAPVGPKDVLDLGETIFATTRNGGEIDLVFRRRVRDKLKVILMIDNGGWSMLPYVNRTRELFTRARGVFGQLKTLFFHNCIYDHVWADPQRMTSPIPLEEILSLDGDHRIIVVGDASMDPYELLYPRGAIDFNVAWQQRRSGSDCLELLARQFAHRVWINPKPVENWERTRGRDTIRMIGQVFPMVDLTLRGIEQAVDYLSE